MRDRTPKPRFYTDELPRSSGRLNILLILAPICFLWNNLWSVCRYITGPISGCSSQDGASQQHMTAPIWKCMSGSGDHRITFLMYLLWNYTFYTNLTIFSITRLLTDDVTNLIVFNLWEVGKIMQHRLSSIRFLITTIDFVKLTWRHDVCRSNANISQEYNRKTVAVLEAKCTGMHGALVLCVIWGTVDKGEFFVFEPSVSGHVLHGVLITSSTKWFCDRLQYNISIFNYVSPILPTWFMQLLYHLKKILRGVVYCSMEHK